MTKQNLDDSNRLGVCPAPLPDRVGETDTFFDSVLFAHKVLQKPRALSQFLTIMLDWCGRSKKSRRYLQNVIDAYYAVGLVARVRLPQDWRRPIVSTLPANSDVRELRRHCLQALTDRISKMDIFWSAITENEPTNTDHLLNLLEAEVFSLDDVKRRVRLLRNLAALEKKGHKYILTPLGRTFASKDTYELRQQERRENVLGEDSFDLSDYADSFGAIDFREI